MLPGHKPEPLGLDLVWDGGSKIVSIYSLGESSFREGTHSAKESSASSTIDNVNVGLHSFTAPPSGQLQIGGFF